MNFNDGDMIRGHYGNTYYRKGGVWLTDLFDFSRPGVVAFGDDTAEWLIGLRVEYPNPSKPTGPAKISKSETQSITYIYRYVYFPGGSND